jgi:putative two-component system response regulator
MQIGGEIADPPPAERLLHIGAVEDDFLEDSGRTVLILDEADVNRRFLRAILKTAPYRILEASRPSDALSLMERNTVDLIVTELMMSEMNGLEFCRLVKNRRETRLLPVLIVTSIQGVHNEVAGLESGADEVLTRPLHPVVVRTRVRAMLRNKALIDSLDEAEAIIFSLGQAIEGRDPYTGGHCARLATYSLALGSALGLGRGDLLALYRGGYLHDIGKIVLSDEILFKPGPLSPEEREEMQTHTVRGEEICRPMKSLAPVLPIIRSHHERWDGSGYPDGLGGEQIPLLARVLQVADIYDALTTARSYKCAMPHADAIRAMEGEAQDGWRDPELISLFAEVAESSLPDQDSLSVPTSLANLIREITQ